MAWTVLAARAPQKQLTRFPAKDQKRILAALQALAEDPFSGDIVKLEGAENRWRRRVGGYRVFFAVDTRTRTLAVSIDLSEKVEIGEPSYVSEPPSFDADNRNEI